MKELVQNRWFKKRKYTITEQSLMIEMKDFNAMTELAISYEHIHKVVLNHKDSGNDNLFFGCMLIGMASYAFLNSNADEVIYLLLFSMVPFIIGLLIIREWFVGKKNFWKIKIVDNQYLIWNKEIPDADTVEAFMDTLFETRDEYLIREYGVINVDLSYGYQLEHFKRLKRLNVWDENEFNAQCQRLKSMHGLSKLGFDFGKFNEN